VSAELHISSLLVHVRPAALSAVRAALAALDGVQIHGASDTGKIVVTLETESSGGIVERLASIRGVAGVLSAMLIFHQIEPLDQTGGG
jgi:nitrate reductase NapD